MKRKLGKEQMKIMRRIQREGEYYSSTVVEDRSIKGLVERGLINKHSNGRENWYEAIDGAVTEAFKNGEF